MPTVSLSSDNRYEFFVAGKPVPQPKVLAGKWGVYERDPKGLAKEWRSKIVFAAKEAMKKNGVTMAGQYVPVSLNMVFYLNPPTKIPKERKEWGHQPTIIPDVSNYAYLVENALKGVCYRDDSQVIDKHERKVYTDDGECGVLVVIRTGDLAVKLPRNI